ncbi:hypothetical protein [Paractinoplanes brasiliensis]|uniref:Uncharacterized protein n=1 Tax=Paractinoplanes brasiliensis TaxID=52695 RepID=A0A4R6K5H1_9ACTN|nr:hypothetical protein [Actinoplanes brasiliensis]TDO42515.1 hypothetical protein C8E87_6288 [Actinoplanes brasiliensis]GID31381.1 hypothetical protein Abr02nite_63640 [Actinoplanes brasiliensis]
MRWLMRVDTAVPVAGLVTFLLVFGVFGGPTDPAPAARWVGLGVLIGPALMVYAHRVAAVWAAVLGAVLWTPLAGSPGTVFATWGYAVVAILVSRLDRPPPPLPVPHRKPPPPYALPHVAAPAEVTGFALLLVAAAGVVWVAVDDAAVPWLAGTICAFSLGCALLARAVRHQSALRRLFTVPQPVHSVRAVEQEGHVHVLLPAEDGRTALEFAFDVAEPEPRHDEDDVHTEAAVLYGDPIPGSWCALEVDRRLHVPVGPVGEVVEVPYDVVEGLPREIEDDEEQLVDPDALRPADRDAGAFVPREHRISPQRAWTATIAIGLGAALALTEVAHLAGLPPGGLIVVAAVAAAAGFEFGWRSQLRPRLRWHAGGVAAVGFRGLSREPWATDSAVVHDDEGTVVLTAGEAVLNVPVPPPWPARSQQRTADQLVAALRDTRIRALALSPLPPPPYIETPRRPLLLLTLWAATVAVTTLIVR